MRGFLSCVSAATILSFAAWGRDPGVPPRTSAIDYPVQGQALTAKIAATVLPPSQASKMFSPDIAKDYVVVEVAIYPDNGVPFDVQSSDFALRVGQKTGRADRPIDVAPWQEKRDPVSRLPVDITAETGVIYDRSNDPVNGRRQGVGTYSGVAVSSPSQNNIPPPPDPRTDPRLVYDKLQRFALPEGMTKTAIAGYLYFPQYGKKKKSDDMELRYSKDADALKLALPKP